MISNYQLMMADQRKQLEDAAAHEKTAKRNATKCEKTLKRQLTDLRAQISEI